MVKRIKLEDLLITLKNINCDYKTKKNLRKAAKDWINYISQHISEIHTDDFINYHQGGISFIEFFFNITDGKKEKDNERENKL